MLYSPSIVSLALLGYVSLRRNVSVLMCMMEKFTTHRNQISTLTDTIRNLTDAVLPLKNRKPVAPVTAAGIPKSLPACSGLCSVL